MTIQGPILLEPGIYRLTRDVTNPRPDRRSTALSDWRNRVTWPAGKLFAVCPMFENDVALELSSVSNYSSTKLMFRRDGRAIERLEKDLERVRAIAEAVEPVTIDSPSLVLLHNERVKNGVGGATSVLDSLFAAGRITLDDVRVALTHCGRSDPEEEGPT